LDKKATRCHFPLLGDCWDKTAPVAKSELSASIRKGRELSGEANIGVEVTADFSELKADCSSVV
jgi:hypothetical protein